VTINSCTPVARSALSAAMAPDAREKTHNLPAGNPDLLPQDTWLSSQRRRRLRNDSLLPRRPQQLHGDRAPGRRRRGAGHQGERPEASSSTPAADSDRR
jgi:hypothetical protein